MSVYCFFCGSAAKYKVPLIVRKRQRFFLICMNCLLAPKRKKRHRAAHS